MRQESNPFGRRSFLAHFRLFIFFGLLGFGTGHGLLAQDKTVEKKRVFTHSSIGDSVTAQRLILEADRKLAEGEDQTTLDLYDRAAKQYRDRLVVVNGFRSVTHRRVKDVVQEKIRNLPESVLLSYRRRNDSIASRKLDTALASRNLEELRKVADTYLCATRGLSALETLADLSFQEGLFEQSLEGYRQLTEFGSELSPLHSGLDLARVRAKALLVRQAIGDDLPDEKELASFALTFPGTEGSLFGRQGKIHEILRSALNLDFPLEPADISKSWESFAGGASRLGRVKFDMEVGEWMTEGELEPSGFSQDALRAEMAAHLYHPLLVDGRLVFSNNKELRIRGLEKGPEQTLGSVGLAKSDRFPVAGNLPFRHSTLTASQKYFFVQTNLAVDPQEKLSTIYPTTAIVALDRKNPARVRWTKEGSEIALPSIKNPKAFPAVIPGTPVSEGSTLYTVVVNGPVANNGQFSYYVVALDAETGAQKWVTNVAIVSSRALKHAFVSDFEPEFEPPLLTLRGGGLYFLSNSGQIARIETSTGNVIWVTDYPRTLPESGIKPVQLRFPNPPVATSDTIYLLPSDSSALLAIEASTGLVRWSTELEKTDEAQYLLGLIDDQVIVTGKKVLVVDKKQGSITETFSLNHKDSIAKGRGLLTASAILWPTSEGVKSINPTARRMSELTLTEADQLRLKSAGGANLTTGNSRLVLTFPDTYSVYRLLK